MDFRFIAYGTACFDTQRRKLEWNVIKTCGFSWSDEGSTVHQISQD